jgi:uncharacterized protein involved in exopolysaccharide biosynthesis
MDDLIADPNSSRKRPGRPVDPFRVRRALWRGRGLLIGAAVLALVGGYLFVKLLIPNSYQTQVVLKYEGDVDLPGFPPTKDLVSSAAGALKNQSVLEEIRKETGFDGTLTALAGALDYAADDRSSIMGITVNGKTGEGVAAFARTVTEVFLRYHRDRQARRIEDEIARVGKRIKAAEREEEGARELYNAFREQHGIADLSTEQQSMVESAAKLRVDSEQAASEIRALEAKVTSLETQLATTPKTSFVGGISPEQTAYQQLRQELASARATLSEDHPRVQALQEQVNQLRSQVRGGFGAGDGQLGVNSTYQSIDQELRETKANLSSLRERQKGLSEMAERAKNRVEAFSEIEGEAAALFGRVAVNENVIGELRQAESILEALLQDPPSGFVVLDPGAVPEYPVKNKVKIVVFGAVVVLAFGVALLVVLRREFRGLRVETPAEVAFWGNGPVLGATDWPGDPRGLDELVAGLDDLAPDAAGTLLIVGNSPDDSRCAVELAARINDDWLPNDVAPPRTPPPTRRGPLQTAPPVRPSSAPPSGPYPISGEGARSTALIRLPSVPTPEPTRLVHRPHHLHLEAWEGPHEGQALRRAARLADRVVVLVRSGAISALKLQAVGNRLGRKEGVGYIVIGLPEELRTLPDRIGDVAAFWNT